MTTLFSETALREALDAFFLESRTEVADELARYSIDESFGGKVVNVRAPPGENKLCGEGKGPYWKGKVRPQRFETTSKMGLLYRPKIVNKIVLQLNRAMEAGSGVVVKGPHGGGKSHSLVNVVRKLESTGNYLVTFIPDCAKWDDAADLYDAMCESFGSTRKKLSENSVNRDTRKSDLKFFVKAVDDILMIKKKTWVFVFDQVMKLLPPLPVKEDLGRLPFPYNQINHLLRKHHRTCVISASANNETALRDNQRGFTNYNYPHPLTMEKAELRLAFLELNDKSDADLDSIIALTGDVPWQVHLRLKLEKDNIIACSKNDEIDRIKRMEIDETMRETLIKDLGSRFPRQDFTSATEIDTFLRMALINDLGMKVPIPSQSELDALYKIEELDRINKCLAALRQQYEAHHCTWKNIVMSIISCLTQVEVTSLDYDRKYSVFGNQAKGDIMARRIRQGRQYAPIHPLVLEAYVDYFWDDLMEYILTPEVILLQTCYTMEATYDTSGRLFRLLVIRRCGLGRIALGNPNENLPEQSSVVKLFDGDELPRIYDDADEHVTYVQRSGKFSTIDLIWKSGKDVWGVKAHGIRHKTVLPIFKQMCVTAGWDTEMENVYLVYLCAERDIANSVCHDLCNEVVDRRDTTAWTPKVQVLCRMDIACFNESRWAHHCTLSPDEIEISQSRKRKETS